MHKNVRLHPPEQSLVHSQKEAQQILSGGGFDVSSHSFGPKDLFVQAVVVSTRH